MKVHQKATTSLPGSKGGFSLIYTYHIIAYIDSDTCPVPKSSFGRKTLRCQENARKRTDTTMKYASGYEVRRSESCANKSLPPATDEETPNRVSKPLKSPVDVLQLVTIVTKTDLDHGCGTYTTDHLD
jgi:hypothetical protein